MNERPGTCEASPSEPMRKIREYLEHAVVISLAVMAVGILAALYMPDRTVSSLTMLGRVGLIVLTAGFGTGLAWQLLRYVRDIVRLGTFAGLHVILVMGLLISVVLCFYLLMPAGLICSVIWTVGRDWNGKDRLLLGGGIGFGLGVAMSAVVFFNTRKKLQAAHARLPFGETTGVDPN